MHSKVLLPLAVLFAALLQVAEMRDPLAVSLARMKRQSGYDRFQESQQQQPSRHFESFLARGAQHAARPRPVIELSPEAVTILR